MKECGADTKKPAIGCNSAPTLCMNYCIHPFKDSNLADTPGKRVGGVGPGGRGHVAVKFGKAFVRHVTVISTSPSEEKEAKDRPAARRSLDFIVDTVSAQHYLGAMLELHKVAVLGAPDKPIEPPAFPPISGNRSAKCSMTGSTRETPETLNVRGKHNISCDTEPVKPDYINEAQGCFARNDIRYRFFIDNAGMSSNI